MEEFVVGNMAWNAGLVGLAGYFIKRWMGSVESQIKRLSDNAENKNTEINEELNSRDNTIANELKERSQYYEEREFKLYKRIDDIFGQLKIANGRMAKNEEAIHIQAALCAERTKHGAISCQDAGNNKLEA